MSFTTWAALCLFVFVSTATATLTGPAPILTHDLDPKFITVNHTIDNPSNGAGAIVKAYLVEFDRAVGAIGSDSVEGVVVTSQTTRTLVHEGEWLTNPALFTPDFEDLPRALQYNMQIEYTDASGAILACENCDTFPFYINRDGSVVLATDAAAINAALYPSSSLNFNFDEATGAADTFKASQEIGVSFADVTNVQILLVEGDIPEPKLDSYDSNAGAVETEVLASTAVSTIVDPNSATGWVSGVIDLSAATKGIEYHLLAKYTDANNAVLECAFGCRSQVFRLREDGTAINVEIEDAEIIELPDEVVDQYASDYDNEAAVAPLPNSVEPTVTENTPTNFTGTHDAGEAARLEADGGTLYEVQVSLYIDDDYVDTYTYSWRNQVTSFQIAAADLPTASTADPISAFVVVEYLNLATDNFLDCTLCVSDDFSITPAVATQADADTAATALANDPANSAALNNAIKLIAAISGVSFDDLSTAIYGYLDTASTDQIADATQADEFSSAATGGLESIQSSDPTTPLPTGRLLQVIAAQNRGYDAAVSLPIRAIRNIARLMDISIRSLLALFAQNKKLGILAGEDAALVQHEAEMNGLFANVIKSPAQGVYSSAAQGAVTDTNAEFCVANIDPTNPAITTTDLCNAFVRNQDARANVRSWAANPLRVTAVVPTLRRVVALWRPVAAAGDVFFNANKATETLGQSVYVQAVELTNGAFTKMAAATAANVNVRMTLDAVTTSDVCKMRTETLPAAGVVALNYATAPILNAAASTATKLNCEFAVQEPFRWVFRTTPNAALAAANNNNGNNNNAAATTTTASNNLSNTAASTATASSDDDSGSSASGIVGIVAGASVACIVVLGLVAFLIFSKSGSSSAGLAEAAPDANGMYGIDKNPYMVPNPTPVGAMQV